MKKIYSFCFLLLLSSVLFAQNGTISGVIRDNESGETLIGANVRVTETLGTVTDIDGKFSIEAPYGDYTLKISYVGYTEITKKVTVSVKPLTLDIKLETIMLNEVSVTADVARTRETPIAFTNILPAKIDEQLSGRDIPMVLNSTPGVYATQQGGGEGDARVTIRGFSQRNVAVMIDGIPVNDMENGWVYWSNWFGLDAVTRSMQVQRGLGASKLALPSVGGTINIITKGFDTKRGGKFSQDIDLEGKYRTSIGFTSGKLKNGWAFTLAGSVKWGDTWVQETKTKGWFYYGKIDKRWGNHISSISGMGAPQQHDQRSFKLPIAVYSSKMAKDLGIQLKGRERATDTLINLYPFYDMGTNYNQHWGYIYRNAEKWNADHSARMIDSTESRQTLNEKVNIYHKPQYSIRDFWTINDKMTVSNVIYMSRGNGGGVTMYNNFKNSYKPGENHWNSDPNSDNYGQIEWNKIVYDKNTTAIHNPFDTTTYVPSLPANDLLVNQKNEHVWYGYVGTLNFKINKNFEYSGGIDARSYTGIHYKEVYDLLGADYYPLNDDNRISQADYALHPELGYKHVGDKIEYYYNGYVRWTGLFSQLEYKGGLFSAFINLTGARSKYKMKNFFLQNKESAWKSIYSGTVKGGVNYNLTENSNVFLNLGYLSKARDYNYFFIGRSCNFSTNIKNEIVKAIEIGYTFGSRLFSVNFNTYYTRWLNKAANPITGTDGDVAYIPGIDAKHKGIECDFVYKPFPNLEIQGLFSLGDWKWDSKIDNVPHYDNMGNLIDYINIDLRNVHVSEGAQTQAGGSIRYEIKKGLYVMSNLTYFGRYYSEFTPESTVDLNTGKSRGDSWQVPDYTLVDFHAGYSWKLKKINNILCNVKINVLNTFNCLYISDAVNNDSNHPRNGYFIEGGSIGSTSDANSATAFFGPPRTATISFDVTF